MHKFLLCLTFLFVSACATPKKTVLLGGGGGCDVPPAPSKPWEPHMCTIPTIEFECPTVGYRVDTNCMHQCRSDYMAECEAAYALCNSLYDICLSGFNIATLLCSTEYEIDIAAGVPPEQAQEICEMCMDWELDRMVDQVMQINGVLQIMLEAANLKYEACVESCCVRVRFP